MLFTPYPIKFQFIDIIISYRDTKVNRLQRPPIRRNHDFLHVSRPADIRSHGRDFRIISSHAGVFAGVVLIAFQPGGVDGHGARHVGQREQVPADGNLSVPRKRDPDHRLGRDTARIGNEGARCRDRDVICLQMEERLTAEGHGKAAVRVTAQNLLKGNLVDHPGMIKAALPVGEGDCAAAAEPRGDLRQAVGILNKAGACQQHVIVHILVLQHRQAAGASGDIGERAALRRERDGRMLRNVNAELRAFLSVPFKPVGHGISFLENRLNFTYFSWYNASRRDAYDD